MENKKMELLKEICSWYNYNLTVEGNKIIDINNEDECNYETVEEGLRDWLETLEESNKCCINEKVEMLWSREEIELIKQLEV